MKQYSCAIRKYDGISEATMRQVEGGKYRHVDEVDKKFADYEYLVEAITEYVRGAHLSTGSPERWAKLRAALKPFDDERGPELI